MLSFDYLHQDLDMLDAIMKHQFKRYKNEKEIVLCLNSHPKTLGSYHLDRMGKFIDIMRSKYPENIEFCGYKDLS